VTGTIRVTNESDGSVVLYVVPRNITSLTPTGLPQLAPPDTSTAFEFASWVAQDSVGTFFAPRETKEVRYRIDVPKDASPGGHFGAIYMQRQPPDVQEDFIGARFNIQVGTVFSLRVAGAIAEDMFIGALKTDNGVYKTSRPTVNFSVDVENRGNVLQRPQGVISITSVSGDRLANILINESAGAAFPGQLRTYDMTWQPEEFTFGRYQAVATIIYGNEVRRTETVTTSFWVLPFKLIFGLLGLLIAVFIGGYIWLRVAVQRRVREVLGNTEAMNRAKEGVSGALPPDTMPQLPKGALITVSLLLALFIFLLVLIFLFA